MDQRKAGWNSHPNMVLSQFALCPKVLPLSMWIGDEVVWWSSCHMQSLLFQGRSGNCWPKSPPWILPEDAKKLTKQNKKTLPNTLHNQCPKQNTASPSPLKVQNLLFGTHFWTLINLVLFSGPGSSDFPMQQQVTSSGGRGIQEDKMMAACAWVFKSPWVHGLCGYCKCLTWYIQAPAEIHNTLLLRLKINKSATAIYSTEIERKKPILN